MIKYLIALDNVIKFSVFVSLYAVERCFVKHALIHDVINRHIILRWPSHDFSAPVNISGNRSCCINLEYLQAFAQ